MFNNHPFIKVMLLFPLLAGVIALCTGCNSLPRSGFDPNGERLFASNPLENLNPFRCDLLTGNRSSSTAVPVPSSNTPSLFPSAQPAATTFPSTPTAVPATTTAELPGFLSAGRTNAAVPQYGSTATFTDPNTRSINTAFVYSPDGTSTAEPFEETGGYALPIEPVSGPAILMTPREQIAPVGSEVVMIASYLGNKDRLITNEKIEWTLDGVGSFLNFDKGSYCDPLFFDYTRAKKNSETYVITKTSQKYQTLDRGTAETRDDIHLLRGQTWVSVNSMKEGSTYITAFAPQLKDWSKHSDFGVIHWIDAQWVLPRLPIAPTGNTRMLTTTVQRRTTGQPRGGWIVRYEIIGGPAAGFGNSGAQIEEVETDFSGQASVMLTQRESQTGTSTIAVKIIRPAGMDGSSSRITVGSEILRQTWAGTASVIAKLQGPASSGRGQDVPYTLTLTNTMAVPAVGLAEMNYSPTASLISSNPPADSQSGGTVFWNVTVPAHSSLDLKVILRSSTNISANANFHSQGSGYIRSTIPSVSPGAPPTVVPKPDPASTVPSVPSNSGANVYVPPVTPPPPATTGGATPYVGTQLKLTIKEATGQLPNDDGTMETIVFQSGKPFCVAFIVQNTGTTAVNNVLLQLGIPQEYVGRISNVRSNGRHNPQNNTVELTAGTIPAGGEAVIQIRLPTITLQGYQFTGRVSVNGREVDKQTERIVPLR
ncbi:MAG: hypothetical protein FWE67_04620 [Planctomycetaceae bacterium]|nr:hypothetical protein [Planctomycetaceae bacterium]